MNGRTNMSGGATKRTRMGCRAVRSGHEQTWRMAELGTVGVEREDVDDAVSIYVMAVLTAIGTLNSGRTCPSMSIALLKCHWKCRCVGGVLTGGRREAKSDGAKAWYHIVSTLDHGGNQYGNAAALILVEVIPHQPLWTRVSHRPGDRVVGRAGFIQRRQRQRVGLLSALQIEIQQVVLILEALTRS